MRPLPTLACLMALAACHDAQSDVARDDSLIARDPVIARALHDPLMSDPDLASRNEANAAIGFVDSAALPVIGATADETQAARVAMRTALIESGPLVDLPPSQPGAGGAVLGPQSGPRELLAAVGLPATCTDLLQEDFALAAALPPPAAIPPRAMVVQAGGADAQGCGLRIVRYLTAAGIEDVLQFHFLSARRAGLVPVRYAAPGDSIVATGSGPQRLAVHVRSAANGLTGVTLVYRAP